MSETTIITPSVNDTFDPAKIVVSGGVAKLVGPPFDTNDPTITLSNVSNVGNLTNFIENAVKPTLSEIKYTILIGGVETHFDGQNWVASDGTYAQANLASEIKDNERTLLINGSFQLKAFLHSDDGTVTPEL